MLLDFQHAGVRKILISFMIFFFSIYIYVTALQTFFWGIVLFYIYSVICISTSEPDQVCCSGENLSFDIYAIYFHGQ